MKIILDVEVKFNGFDLSFLGVCKDNAYPVILLWWRVQVGFFAQKYSGRFISIKQEIMQRNFFLNKNFRLAIELY